MRALTREQSADALKILGKLAQKVRRYAKSHAPEANTTPQHRLHDSVALVEACEEAEDFIIAFNGADLNDRIKYQLAVISLLTIGPEGTRSDRPRHTLSDAECREMEEAYETGVDPVDFAHMLAKRDVAAWEEDQQPLNPRS